MNQEEEELLKRIGQQIRYYRKLRHLTQEQLGEEACVCHKYLGEIERGNKNIGIMMIFRLAQALHISIADLLNCPLEQADSYQKYMRLIFKLLNDQGSENLKRILQIIKCYLRMDH